MRKVEKRIIARKAKLTMLAPKVRVNGMVWEFHKGDNDDRPSVPHGHSRDGKYKLQLWNGLIYEIQTGQVKYKAKRKEMTALYNFPGFLDFVNECRAEYQNRNPAIKLPELLYRGYKSGRKKTTANKADSFVFFIKNDRV